MTPNNKITTIKLSKETKNRLEHIKEHKRESYEEVLQKMLEILNICKANPLKARARLMIIDKKNRAKTRRQISQIKPQTLKPLINSRVRMQ